MTTQDLQWHTKAYKELSLDMLYDILQLRNEVFVVEQAACYQDADDKDTHLGTWHIMAYKEKTLQAYLRAMAPGSSYPNHVSIGRVVVRKSARGTGAGHTLVDKGTQLCSKIWPCTDIRISAQAHLRSFYEAHLFKNISEKTYMEDGIPHIAMIRAHT